MVSRRDQFQAYRFMARRHAAALLSDDPDAAGGSVRRLSTGATGSVVVALLVLVAVGVVGLFRPGSASWTDGRSLILDRDSGTRYVYLDGVLRPVLNYASARLILHGGGATPAGVSGSDLAKVPHGAPVGIPGAPDLLPAKTDLLGPQWTVCSYPATEPSGAARPRVEVGGGQPAGVRPLSGGAAILASGPHGGQYLLWNGQRLRVSGGYALTALGYDGATTAVVGDAWLNALPQGPDLAAPVAQGIGTAGRPVGGAATRVGQVFQAAGSTTGYVMLPDGLAPLTDAQLRLQLAFPGEPAAYPGDAVRTLPISAQQVAATGTSASAPARVGGLPAVPPVLLDTRTNPFAVCATVDESTGAPALTTLPATAGTVTGSGGTPVDVLGGPVADRFDLAPDQGALVRAVPAPGVTTGTVYLIDGLGTKFPLAGENVLADLGYQGVSPVPLPDAFLGLFPTGPTLSEDAAARALPAVPSTRSPAPVGSTSGAGS